MAQTAQKVVILLFVLSVVNSEPVKRRSKIVQRNIERDKRFWWLIPAFLELAGITAAEVGVGVGVGAGLTAAEIGIGAGVGAGLTAAEIGAGAAVVGGAAAIGASGHILDHGTTGQGGGSSGTSGSSGSSTLTDEQKLNELKSTMAPFITKSLQTIQYTNVQNLGTTLESSLPDGACIGMLIDESGAASINAGWCQPACTHSEILEEADVPIGCMNGNKCCAFKQFTLFGSVCKGLKELLPVKGVCVVKNACPSGFVADPADGCGQFNPDCCISLLPNTTHFTSMKNYLIG